MHGALEFPLEHRPVDFAQLTQRGLIFNSHDDAVGMQEIPHGGTLAEEFGIGRHMEGDVALAAVDGQGALQFLACSRGDGALLDDQLGRFRFGGHHARDVVDGAQVGLAAGPRRCAYTDEKGVAVGEGLSGVVAKFQPAFLAHPRNDFFEPRFVYWKAAGFKRLYFSRVAIGAHYVVTNFRHTSPGDEADVSRADYGYLQ